MLQIFVLCEFFFFFCPLHTFLHYHTAKVFRHKGRTPRCHGNHIHSPGCEISQCVLSLSALQARTCTERRDRATSERPTDTPTSRRAPGRPKQADALPRPQADGRPIHLPSPSGDKKGRRQQRARQGRGRPEWEDEKRAKPKRQKAGICDGSVAVRET